MRCAPILTTCLLLPGLSASAATYDLANPGFEDLTADGRPSGWNAYGWDRPREGLQLTVAGGAATGARCLQLAATDAGASGAISSVIPLTANPLGVRVRLQVRASADYVGNSPWFFLSCHRAGAFLGTVPLAVPPLIAGEWRTVDVVIPGDRLTAGCDALHLNLATRRDASASAVGGTLSIDAVQLSEDLTLPPITLACDQFAQLTTLGEALTFHVAQGRIPPTAVALRGTISDSEGHRVTAIDVPVAEVTAHGWRWQPEQSGFYEIAFSLTLPPGSATSELPLTSSYHLRTPAKRELDFTRERWSVGVASRPTRPMAKRSAQFGFSYQLGPEHDIQAADALGLSFARIQAIAWGSQFADIKQAIEPQKGVYHWEDLDRKVGWLQQRGFAMVGNVIYTPQWASPHPEDTKINICVPGFAAWAPKDMNDWTNFLRVLVNRYGDRINTWELWNEPHLPGGSCFWQDTPERFVELLRSGYSAIKEVQPNSEIWIGGIGMRYIPFYRQLAKLGGAPFYDRLALHGSWVDPQPFQAIDRLSGVTPRPWVTSEHHGILLNPESPAASEPALAKRLVLDTFSQLAKGSERIALFELPNLMDSEVLPEAKKEGWFIHSSGLFRSRPRMEPRLAAVVWREVVGAVNPGMHVRGEHRVGSLRLLACANGTSDFVLLWHDEATAQPMPAELADLVASSETTDWEGRPFTGSDVPAGIMLLLRRADAATVARLPTGEALPRAAGPLAVTGPIPEGTAIWGALPASPTLIPATTYVNGATPEAVKAAFAVSYSADTLLVQVDVADPEHMAVEEPGKYWAGDSIQIGIDTGAAGISGDQAQFIAALTSQGPVVWKDAAPYVGGDLPSGWTPAGQLAKYAVASITPIPGGLRYVLRIARSELYPLVPDASQPLKFSLLVNSNRGQGRAGWVEWGSGIGLVRNPAAYGILRWSQP
jgi:hypothetical protein